MSSYLYKCFDCGKEYSAVEIEESFTYLCPSCGKCERNMPLVGVLQIRYDYEALKKQISRENFLKGKSGSFWEHDFIYPIDALTVEHQARVKSLRLTRNAVTDQMTKSAGGFMVFDDTLNPTLSYKDRATSLVVVKAMQQNITEIAAASTGNAGSSLAGLSARIGIRAHVFCPKRIPLGKRIQIQAFGAQIYLVDGSYDDAFDLCLEVSAKNKWYNRNTAYNPLTIEGKKSSVLDMFIELNGKLPDVIFVPTGDGVIIAGIYKGIYDLMNLGWIEKMPRLVAVQASGSDALYRFVRDGKFEFVSADTVADSISASSPRNLYMAAHAVKETSGEVVCVTDEEILDAQAEIIRETGLMIEPASSSAYAGLKKYINEGKLKANEIPMTMFTGNGLKDPNALSIKNPEPEAKSYAEWVKVLS